MPTGLTQKTYGWKKKKHLCTRYLDDFGRLGIHVCLLNWRFWKLISRSYMFSSSCWMMISGQVKSLESWNEVITKKIRTLISSFGKMWTSLSILTPQKCLFWEPGPLLYRFQPLHWRVQGSLGMLESHHVSLVFFGVKLFERIWKGLWVSFFLDCDGKSEKLLWTLSKQSRTWWIVDFLPKSDENDETLY